MQVCLYCTKRTPKLWTFCVDRILLSSGYFRPFPETVTCAYCVASKLDICFALLAEYDKHWRRFNSNNYTYTAMLIYKYNLDLVHDEFAMRRKFSKYVLVRSGHITACCAQGNLTLCLTAICNAIFIFRSIYSLANNIPCSCFLLFKSNPVRKRL